MNYRCIIEGKDVDITLKKAIKFAIFIFIGIRIFTSLVLLIGILQPPSVSPNEEYAQAVDYKLLNGGFISRHLLEPWFRWDTTHYLEIAEEGYSAESYNTVWPPFYPFLIKLVSFIFKPPILAAIIVSNIFFIAATVLFYLFVTKILNEDIAKNSIFYLLLFPTSFFLMAPYTEPLFLAFTLGVFYASHQKKWLLAGVLSGLAALTRVQGVFLIIPILVDGYLFYRPSGSKTNYLKFLPASLIAPFAYGLYCLYVRFGIRSEWPWVTLNTNWGQHFSFPWEGIWGNLTALFGRNVSPDYTLSVVKILSLLTMFLSVYFLLRISKIVPISIIIYAWLSLGLVISKVDDQSLMISTMRYLLMVFPIFISQAIFITKKIYKILYFAFGVSINIVFLVLNYWWIWVA